MCVFVPSLNFLRTAQLVSGSRTSVRARPHPTTKIDACTSRRPLKHQTDHKCRADICTMRRIARSVLGWSHGWERAPNVPLAQTPGTTQAFQNAQPSKTRAPGPSHVHAAQAVGSSSRLSSIPADNENARLVLVLFVVGYCGSSSDEDPRTRGQSQSLAGPRSPCHV